MNNYVCPFCGGDELTAKLAKAVGMRPDVAFLKLRKTHNKIVDIINYLEKQYVCGEYSIGYEDGHSPEDRIKEAIKMLKEIKD